MKTEKSTDISEQTSAPTIDQPAPDAGGKRSLGLKIRARVGMPVSTNLKAGGAQMEYSARCSYLGCTHTCH